MRLYIRCIRWAYIRTAAFDLGSLQCTMMLLRPPIRTAMVLLAVVVRPLRSCSESLQGMQEMQGVQQGAQQGMQGVQQRWRRVMCMRVGVTACDGMTCSYGVVWSNHARTHTHTHARANTLKPNTHQHTHAHQHACAMRV